MAVAFVFIVHKFFEIFGLEIPNENFPLAGVKLQN